MVTKFLFKPSMALQAYHDQEHLLFQFLIAEMVLAHGQIMEIEKTLSSSNQLVDKHFLDNIATSLVRLCGSGQSHMRLFAWGDDGILTKLRNYCTFFAEKDSSHLKRGKLHQQADRLWLSTLYALDLIRVIYQQIAVRDVDATCFEPALLKIKKGFKRFADHVKTILIQFRHDENVLLFFLRNHKEIDRIYGERFVHAALRKMFSRNLNQDQQFIEERYRLRGFYHVIPLIQHHFRSLKT